jgi:GNAT superfamily N-acetyltransferase
MPTAIRATHPDEAAELQVIEVASGQQFRDVGLDFVADHDPTSLDAFARYATAGRSWAALDSAGDPIGFVLVDDVDGNAHVEQVSVRPDHQGTGVGRALIDRACEWARDSGRPAVTLTTFKDVAWNAPLYVHIGFRVMPDGEIGPQLRAICDEEAARGLDPATRVCMRMEVAGTS